MFDDLRQHWKVIATVVSISVGAYVWIESHFINLNDRFDTIELQIVESKAGITEAVDRHAEALSREHQQNSANIAQMLVSIGHDLGYAERLAQENDHGHKERAP